MPIPGEYEPATWDVAAEQVARIEASGGTDGFELNGAPCVVLWTRGRKSGKVRKSPVIRVTDGTRYAVLGSMGGAPQHPNWYFNLVDDPQVSLQDGPEVRDYTARPVQGTERTEWWERAVEVWPPYAEYQTRTERVIPVVVLDPR
jgi:deazaflavin-dependent oxidoreductase (nitroreductase family)